MTEPAAPSDTPEGSIALARKICEEVMGELPDNEQYGSVDCAVILSRRVRVLERRCAELEAQVSRLRQSEAELREVLEMWIYRGNLQTFEDRERFRAAARAALGEPKK